MAGALGRSFRGRSKRTNNLLKFSTPGTPVASQQGASDLTAFGPSRHRAWVVGQSPPGCFLGSIRSALGGRWGAVLVPLGGFLGASWGFLGASWGPLGVFLALPGGLSGPRARNVRSSPPSGPPLGAVLGASWAVLGLPEWGSFGGFLCRLGSILEASWAVLKRRETEKATTPKSFRNLKNMYDVCLLGPPWEASSPVGKSSRPLGPPGGRLQRLCDSEPSWSHLGPSGGGALLARLGALLVRTSHASNRGGARCAPVEPRKLHPGPLKNP